MLPTSTYPMWYNVKPPLVPLDHSLYRINLTKTKELDSSIFRNYTSYVLGNVYQAHEQPIIPPTYIPYLIGDQFLTMVQPMARKDRQPI
jgi:hypothetical protein